MNQEIEWLEGLYVQKVNELYQSEAELLKILPQMMARTQSAALQRTLQYFGEKTRSQITRLERILIERGTHPTPGGHLLEKYLPANVLDDRLSPVSTQVDDELIEANEKIKHAEIVTCLLALNCAQILHDPAAVERLETMLHEEYEAERIWRGLGERLHRAQYTQTPYVI